MATLLLIIIYIAFISLGLPDALLGSAWPVMQPDLNVPYAFAGIPQIMISGGTILSALFSGLLLKKYGTGKVTAVSVSLTAIALIGFSFSPSLWWLLVFTIPMGLGAGSVDAGLNAYVANNYKPHLMSWLHCFWGIGALGGPLVMSMLLSKGFQWRLGYRSIGIFQVCLVFILIISLPLWDKVKKENEVETKEEESGDDIPFFSVLKVKGVLMALLIFLFYCGIELTMGLWGGSYLFKVKNMTPSTAAIWISIYYGGITIGRFFSGFLTFKLSNNSMIRLGISIVLLGVLFMLLPLPQGFVQAGFLLVGLGCAPIFPSMLHETPVRFGKKNAQAVMGFQMAAAYVGSTVFPPMFGFIASSHAMYLFPFFLLGYIIILIICFERLKKVVAKKIAS
ncbi:MAG: MFS transporter [Spirochaetales bacterium]|nr:MFS transporter [Spirochaetales bacterium]